MCCFVLFCFGLPCCFFLLVLLASDRVFTVFMNAWNPAAVPDGAVLSLWACEMQTEAEAAVCRLPVHIPFCLVRESGDPGRLIWEPVLLSLC